MNVDTGYRIREGSRILAERFAATERERIDHARQLRLAVIRKNLWVAVKALDAEIKAAA